ncbi:hypothetical protein [Hyphobacterium sp.]|uniref:hypothetical protein n=1 Tax=Hyphobacterium sp. TaxID=2004662 RepID=UPI003BACCBC1
MRASRWIAVTVIWAFSFGLVTGFIVASSGLGWLPALALGGVGAGSLILWAVCARRTAFARAPALYSHFKSLGCADPRAGLFHEED